MLFRFAIRILKKKPFLNIIKILGLALGLSGILFITLFLKNELSYDKFNKKAERIYRMTKTDTEFINNEHFARIPDSEIIPCFAAYFPEVESYVRLSEMRGGVLLHNNTYYNINEAFVCDSTFFTIFDDELLVGNKKTILDNPCSMVVSESFAKKVFGNSNPVGQILTLPAGQFYGTPSNFTIKGVMKDFPQNSHFHPELIASSPNDSIEWWAYTYLLLKPNANPQNIISKYNDYLKKTINNPKRTLNRRLYLQKLTDIHLHSNKLREIEDNGNMTNIYVLGIAALILLLISISNFTSLNLGMASFNQKFIAINQIFGSSRNTTLKYFTIESVLIIILSILLTSVISIFANKYIQSFSGINLYKGNFVIVVLVVFIFALISILAGLQPLFKQKVKKLYNHTDNNLAKTKSIFVSKVIVITQYTFTIALIIAVIVISRQTNFALNNSMGMNEKNIICFESVHTNVQDKFELFKNELLKHNSIESVSAMLEPPGGEANDMFNFELEGTKPSDDEDKNMIGIFPCDYSFASLFHLQFLGGNNFSKNNLDNDGSGEFLINETAMHFLGYSNPEKIIGKRFKLQSPSPFIKIPSGKITGVVKDFHLSNIKNKVGPLVMFKRSNMWLFNFVVEYKPGMRDKAINDIQKVWTEIFPAYPFNYQNVDTLYHNVYKTELLQTKLLSIFTFIALFICSMGLLGISLLVSQQRTKEIGIRKVNGAKISEIMLMLNKDFVKWVTVAFVIATPIAYYAMNKWLENFAYKTSLSWWIFALAGLLTLGVALLTVSSQSWRAATKNPVEALRYE